MRFSAFSLMLALALHADKAPPPPTKRCPKCNRALIDMGGGQWVCSLDPDKCREDVAGVD